MKTKTFENLDLAIKFIIANDPKVWSRKVDTESGKVVLMYMPSNNQ